MIEDTRLQNLAKQRASIQVEESPAGEFDVATPFPKASVQLFFGALKFGVCAKRNIETVAFKEH
jgi:hypothetical protein